MAKNIIIQSSDGSTRLLNNISHIVTDLQSSSDKCVWIPKDEIEADTNVILSFVNNTYSVRVTLEDVDNKSY